MIETGSTVYNLDGAGAYYYCAKANGQHIVIPYVERGELSGTYEVWDTVATVVPRNQLQQFQDILSKTVAEYDNVCHQLADARRELAYVRAQLNKTG
jgi:hypothetical protein